MVEIQRMFGTDHFVFYDMDIATKALTYIQYYERIGFADVIKWKLPKIDYITRYKTFSHYIDVYYYAQVAAYHDCLLRHLNKSTYITFLDLDENLVPRKYDNLIDLLQHHKHVPCALIFRNVFFRKELASDYNMTKDKQVMSYNLNTLLKTQRESRIWPGGDRSKYIARTRSLYRPSIHTPGWGCGVEDNRSMVLNPEMGLLHHYRSMPSISVRNATTDNTMLKYRDAIVARVERVFEAIPTL